MNQNFHRIQEKEEDSTDPKLQEKARDEFDTHPKEISAEGTAPDTTEDSDYLSKQLIYVINLNNLNNNLIIDFHIQLTFSPHVQT
jgi:hypothetical protein